MDKKVLQAPAQIEGVSTMKDGSIKLSVYTRELPPEEMTALFSLRGAMGWFMFAQETKEFDDVDIPDIKVDVKEKKSLSQIQRNIIYRIWENNTDHSQEFKDYYERYMIKLNDMLKERI